VENHNRYRRSTRAASAYSDRAVDVIDNLNYKIQQATSVSDHLDCLTYAHYEFIRIHPFNNGNGRTGRMLMNLLALKLGYQPMELYHREGESSMTYINAMKTADGGDFEPLKKLIEMELEAL
jgi:cell filamentation protein